ncbi:TnsA-like heteromeric transposase endonuclease subunit [Streptomyces sp. AK010]|uniref:TnsA-like heteromeric transposase endonuclease subunit n=1 Tax=Streptomyces sp. AK010 TaxID=2723074 RepID=UPI00179F7506|nr:TnsA-like heteromeric transposase endonuclease subunit [Streptomyces sp. AK010]MBB6416637.1 hypothetical protein [Streptomyces sp. AK010]
MSTTDLAASVQVSVRQADECVVEDLEWASAPLDLLRHAQPWRTFRWYKGQQHYSGTYWAATVRDHVIYESRLELARLLFADFAPDVRHVVAQPFLLKAVVEGRQRRHIPDYLLLTDDGPVVVDVKPRHRLERPKVAFTFAWTRAAVASRGWRYEVWSEPDPHEVENASASSPATAGTGCSIRASWTVYGPVSWRDSRWARLSGCCPTGPGRW